MLACLPVTLVSIALCVGYDEEAIEYMYPQCGEYRSSCLRDVYIVVSDVKLCVYIRYVGSWRGADAFGSEAHELSCAIDLNDIQGHFLCCVHAYAELR